MTIIAIQVFIISY